jgi:predicted nuclease of predicted toxin-antitoxin system
LGSPDKNIIEVCQQENRILVTLDLDFADTRAYPPQNYPGIIILTAFRQDKYLSNI